VNCKKCNEILGGKMLEGIAKTTGRPWKAYKCPCGEMNFIRDNYKPNTQTLQSSEEMSRIAASLERIASEMVKLYALFAMNESQKNISKEPF